MGETLRQRIKQSKFEGPGQEAMLNLLVAAGHVRQLVDEVCATHGLTQGQFNVLRILRGRHPEGYSRCEIAARMVERAPDVTRLTDRLEVQGLVERVRGSEDRRQSITRITRDGLAVLRRLDRPIADISRRLEQRLSGRDLRELSRLCEHVYGEG